MLKVVPAVPSCQVVQHMKGGQGKRGWQTLAVSANLATMSGSWGVAGAVLPGSRILLGRWLMEQARQC